MKSFYQVAILVLIIGYSVTAVAQPKIGNENQLRQLLASNSQQTSAKANKPLRLEFKKNVVITLTAPAIYQGPRPLIIKGNGATIDGHLAGGFVLNADNTATTKDASLLLKTDADIRIENLNIIDSASRGLVVEIPVNSRRDDVRVELSAVNIKGSALYGLHIDDNSDEFDDGSVGSPAGIALSIKHSLIVDNGIGALDFDGVRVDERSEGDIRFLMSDSKIIHNGGDGIELDEAGEGDVSADVRKSIFDSNGFYNEADLDDGFDIDEADEGDLILSINKVSVLNNKDEGLDFDEAGDGELIARLRRIEAANNTDEGIKLDEEDQGDLLVNMKKITVNNNGDDGIQFTELGEGKIKSRLKSIKAVANAKYGIKMEQWLIEDEAEISEAEGTLSLRKIKLEDNGKGDEIKRHNVGISNH